jgi:hypothetical protein
MPGLDMVGSRKVEQVAAYEREACGETPIIDPESGLMSLSGKAWKASPADETFRLRRFRQVRFFDR